MIKTITLNVVVFIGYDNGNNNILNKDFQSAEQAADWIANHWDKMVSYYVIQEYFLFNIGGGNPNARWCIEVPMYSADEKASALYNLHKRKLFFYGGKDRVFLGGK